jgi:hypothetical protein
VRDFLNSFLDILKNKHYVVVAEWELYFTVLFLHIQLTAAPYVDLHVMSFYVQFKVHLEYIVIRRLTLFYNYIKCCLIFLVYFQYAYAILNNV